MTQSKEEFEKQIRTISTAVQLDNFLQKVDVTRLHAFRQKSEKPPFLHLLVKSLPKLDSYPIISFDQHSFNGNYRDYSIYRDHIDSIRREEKEKCWIQSVAMILQKHKDKLQPSLKAIWQYGDVFINALSFACMDGFFCIAKILYELGVPFQEVALAHMSEYMARNNIDEEHLMKLVNCVLPEYSRFLTSKTSIIGEFTDYPLIRQIRNNRPNMEMIKTFIKCGAKVTQANQWGNFFFWWIGHSVFESRRSGLRELIMEKHTPEELKRSINYVNDDGRSLLQSVLSFSSITYFERFVSDWGDYIDWATEVLNFDFIKNSQYSNGGIFHHLTDRIKLLNLSTDERIRADRIQTQVVNALNGHVINMCNKHPQLRREITGFLKSSTSSPFHYSLEDVLRYNFNLSPYPQLGFEITPETTHGWSIDNFVSIFKNIVGFAKSKCTDNASNCIFHQTFGVGTTSLEYLLLNIKYVGVKNAEKFIGLMLGCNQNCNQKQVETALSNKVVIEEISTYANFETLKLLVDSVPSETVKELFAVMDDQQNNVYHWTVKNAIDDPERFTIISYFLAIGVDPDRRNKFGLNFLEVSTTRNIRSMLEHFILNTLSEEVVSLIDSSDDAIKAIIKLKCDPILHALIKRLKRLPDRYFFSKSMFFYLQFFFHRCLLLSGKPILVTSLA